MKKPIFFVFLLLSASCMHSMEVEGPSDIVFLVNRATGERFPFTKDLFPHYSFEGFKNEISTQLKKPFVDVIRKLLYTHKGMECVGRLASQKCLKDIRKFFQNSSVAESHDFISWFELAYFVDVCNLPSIIKDQLLYHVTKLIKDHEQEAALASASIEDAGIQATLESLWKSIASFYYLLFDQELEVEGRVYEPGYSIQQLFVIGSGVVPYTKRGNWCLLNLNNRHINSLEGWELLFTWLPKNERVFMQYVLDLSHNDISFIPKDFLFNMSNIVEINLGSNKLVQLHDNFLASSIRLQRFNCSNNKLQELPANFLSNMPGLESVILSDNELKVLPDNFLANSPGLHTFNCSNNKLQELPANFLSNTPGLMVLYLFRNKLKVLPDNFLVNSPGLRAFSCSNNKLQELPANFLSNMPGLESVTLSDNELKVLPDNFLANSLRLQRFNCSSNKLQELPVNFLSNTPQLIYMSLLSNKLQMLPDTFLSNSPNLQKVSLRGNQLATLPPLFLYGCDKLQLLLIKNSDGSYPQHSWPATASIALMRGQKLQEEAEESEKAEKRKREEEEFEQGREKRQKK